MKLLTTLIFCLSLSVTCYSQQTEISNDLYSVFEKMNNMSSPISKNVELVYETDETKIYKMIFNEEDEDFSMNYNSASFLYTVENNSLVSFEYEYSMGKNITIGKGINLADEILLTETSIGTIKTIIQTFFNDKLISEKSIQTKSQKKFEEFMRKN